MVVVVKNIKLIKKTEIVYDLVHSTVDKWRVK